MELDVLVPDPTVEADPMTEAILTAALGRFREFGIRRTTMEDIARTVGISRMSIYRRFPDRDALVKAVVLGEARAFFSRFEAAVDACETTDDLLAEGFAFALAHSRAHPLIKRLLGSDPEFLLPYLTTGAGPIITAATEFLAGRLSREVEEGRLGPVDLGLAAELLVRLVHSFLLLPESVAALDTDADARRFARLHLAPALRGAGESAKDGPGAAIRHTDDRGGT